MKKMEIRKLENKLSQDGDGLNVKGYVNMTGEWSHILSGRPKSLGANRNQPPKQWIERILPNTFQKAIDKATKVDFLAEHEGNLILSSTKNDSLKLYEDEKGLVMEAKISETSWGNDYFTLIKDNLIDGMSFGMRVLKDKWSNGDNGILKRDIEEIEIFEISAVKSPAYPQSILEARGIDVIDNVVPNEIKEETNLNEEVTETELTPRDMYQAILDIKAIVEANAEAIKVLTDKDETETEKVEEKPSESTTVADETTEEVKAEDEKEEVVEEVVEETDEEVIDETTKKDEEEEKACATDKKVEKRGFESEDFVTFFNGLAKIGVEDEA